MNRSHRACRWASVTGGRLAATILVAVGILSVLVNPTSAQAVEGPVAVPGAVWPSSAQEPLWSPAGVAVDEAGGFVYVADADRNQVVKYSVAGARLTAWGSFGSLPGQLSGPRGVALGPDGNLYVADTGNNRVQVFTAGGTLVRTWGEFGTGPGQFSQPSGIAVTAAGVFVSDTQNHRVQKLSTDGTPISQWGSIGASSANFNSPAGIAVDALGSIYVADANNHRIKHMAADGTVLGTWGFYTVGEITYSRYSAPLGVAVDGSGRVWVADTGNSQVERALSVTPYGAEARYGSLGTDDRQLRTPGGIAVGPSGRIYIADTLNSRVQVWEGNGTFVRNIGADSAQEGGLRSPASITRDQDGNFYVADAGNDRVEKFGSSGTFMASWGASGTGLADYSAPQGITTDATGTIWVADTGNKRVKQLAPDGTVLSTFTTVLGSDPEAGKNVSPRGIAVDPDGLVYVADAGLNRIQVFSPSGSLVRVWGSTGSAHGQFNQPTDLALYGTGASARLAVADSGNGRIEVYTFDGLYQDTIGSVGSALGQLRQPSGIAVSPAGRFIIADTSNSRVQEYEVGSGFVAFGSLGVATGKMRAPVDVVTEGDGKLFVLDRDNHRVQELGLDRQAPMTNAIGSFGDWVNGSVDVTLTATDDLSGVATRYYTFDGGAVTTYTASVSFDEEGSAPFEYWSVDNVGHEEYHKTMLVMIDKTDPQTSIDVTSGVSYARGRVVSLTTSDTLSGKLSTNYSINGGLTREYLEPFSLDQTGTVRIDFWSVDRAGNTEDTRTVTVTVFDGIPRTSAVASDAWTKGSVMVTLTASVDGSLAVSTYYQIGPGATTPYSAPFPVSLEGEVQVRYWSETTVGREETQSVTVRVDNTPPQLSSNVTVAPDARSATVTVSYTDTGSGVSVKEYRVGASGDWLPYTGAVVVTSTGSTTVYYRAEDAVGNVASGSRTFDLANPNVSAPITTGVAKSGWQRTPVTVSLSATGGVGPVTTYYQTSQQSEPVTYTRSFEVTASGITTVTFWSECEGAVEATQSLRVMIDRTAPVIAKLFSTTHGSSSRAYRAKYAKFVWRGTDSQSGVTAYAIRFDTRATSWPSTANPTTRTSWWTSKLQPGTYYMHVRARDAAGNWGPVSHRRIRVAP